MHNTQRIKTIDPIKPQPTIAIDVLEGIEPAVLEDSHVYVHCYFDNPYTDALIRIWASTFLIDRDSHARSGLLHAENISLAPQWTLIPDNVLFRFLLVFSALPKSCTVFDLLEDIPQAGGFHFKNIHRNTSDVYHIIL